MGLFSSSKIEGSELQECLAYFEAETRVIAFQTKEADLFNNAMVKYGNSVMQNPLAAEDMKKAANRLSQAAAEILKRHEKIKNVPVAASAMRSAWHETFLANATWASAMVTAIESNIFAFLSAAQGMNPQIKRAQQCSEELQKAWQRADNEDKKFLKKLKVSVEDITEILSRATISITREGWEPNMANASVNPKSGMSIDERESGMKEEHTTINSNDAVVPYNLGVTYQAQGKLDAAAEAYREAIKLDPDNASAHYDLGIALTHQGMADAAIFEYKEVIRINPNHIGAHHNLGSIYQNQFQFDAAEEKYKEALRIDPNNVDVHNSLGTLYKLQAKLVEAQEEYKEALRIDPSHAVARHNYGSAYLLAYQTVGKSIYLDAALEQFKEALRIDPNNADWHYDLGNTYYDQLNYVDAVEEYTEAIRINTKLIRVHYKLGLAYQSLGKLDAAMEEYKETLSIDPDFALPYYHLGDGYYTQGKFNEALRCYQDYIRLAPYLKFERESYLEIVEEKIRQLKQTLEKE